MARALELARRARGSTSPNPPVGAVLVKDAAIVGEGFTQPPGKPHAEIVALARAGARAALSSLYVTLEPCSHWGRTPPCTEALIAAGIREVHVALLDPNPIVNGTGVEQLRRNGITVEIGECGEEAAEIVEGHTMYITQGRPFLTLAIDVAPDVLTALRAESDVVVTDPIPARRSVDDLLTALGHEGVTSGLVIADSDAADALLARGFIDKIVAGREAQVPPGFSERAAPVSHAGHRLLYRRQ